MTKYNSLKVTTVAFLALASTAYVQASSTAEGTNDNGKEARTYPSSPTSYPGLSGSSLPTFGTSGSVGVQSKINLERGEIYQQVFGSDNNNLEQDDRTELMKKAIDATIAEVKAAQDTLDQTEKAFKKVEEYREVINSHEQTLSERSSLISKHNGVSDKDLINQFTEQKADLQNIVEKLGPLSAGSKTIAELIASQQAETEKCEKNLALLDISVAELNKEIKEKQKYIIQSKTWTTVDDHQKKVDSSLERFHSVCDLKSRTVFDLQYGEIYPQETSTSVLKKMGFDDQLIARLDLSRWHGATLRFLTLPILSPQLTGDVSLVFKKSLNKLKESYSNRLRDLLAFAPCVEKLVEGTDVDFTEYQGEEAKHFQKFLVSNSSAEVKTLDDKGPQIFFKIVNDNSPLGNRPHVF